jgi:hypothetical protein
MIVEDPLERILFNEPELILDVTIVEKEGDTLLSLPCDLEEPLVFSVNELLGVMSKYKSWATIS